MNKYLKIIMAIVYISVGAMLIVYVRPVSETSTLMCELAGLGLVIIGGLTLFIQNK